MSVISRFRELYEELASVTPEKLRAVYADDVVFIDPIQTHTGIDAVTNYFASLLSQTASCRFDIDNLMTAEPNTNNINYVVTWTMTLDLKGRASPIVLDGITQLRVVNDEITYHRDHYDLGQMVYEHIPVLGFLVKKIKKRLSQ